MNEFEILDTNNDLILAQTLQYEYDLEYDKILNIKEKNLNKGAKVQISLDNYKYFGPSIWKQEDKMERSNFLNEEDLYEDEDIFDINEKKGIVTKHDANVCGRKNMTKFMKAPISIDTGDCDGENIKLANNVYNNLKANCAKLEKRRHRLHEKKDASTAELAIDSKTRLMLFKLINQSVLSSMTGCISSGKEACVYHAYLGDDVSITHLPEQGAFIASENKECAIKIYKTVLTDFKHRQQYIIDDYKFKDVKINPKKLIKRWAEKETNNLRKMQSQGINVPAVITLHKHMLIMSFIGHNGIPAPKIKDALYDSQEMSMAYREIIEMMRALFNLCHLVHADLSEYNILWHQGKCVVIDVGQSVSLAHPKALEFLFRDCENISKFFARKGLKDIESESNLFNMITNLNINNEGTPFFNKIKTYDKRELIRRIELESKDYDTEQFLSNFEIKMPKFKIF
ncbi:unnamed protein product [Gordionus sp. m RMFG-2023]|uniref:serine/threonine-protein kinase RIO3-like n=1 Tax=Gordionus sp. m RMFG-2023 TaxID=3053472 RepID=UPI0030E59E5E